MKIFLFQLLLFLGFTSVLLAQNHFSFQHYGVEQGLSGSNITALFQDSNGYLWIGTANGLNRGNGSSFKVFNVSADSTNTLPNHKIRSVFEDKNKMIWVGTSAGLSKYDPQTEKFTNFTKVGDCKNCLAGRIIKVIREEGDYLWLGTNAGLSKINTKTHQITSWWHKKDTENIPQIYSIIDMLPLKNGSLLLATDEGLIEFDPRKNVFKQITIPINLREKGLGTLFQDALGTIWIGTDYDGVIQMTGDIRNPAFQHLPQLVDSEEGKTTVYDFEEDQLNRLWIASYFGVAVFDQKNNTINYYRSETDNPASISQNAIKKLYRDAQNRIWLGSPAGLDVYDPYLNQFEILKHNNADPQSISSNNAFSILEDSQGYLWFGFMDSGITVLWKDENGEEKYHHIKQGNGDNHLRSSAIYSLEEDKKGNIWASSPGGLHIISWPDRNNFEYTISTVPEGSIAENKLPEKRIYEIVNDAGNKTWLATHGAGIIAFDGDGKARQFRYKDQNPETSSKDYVVTLAIDPQQRIWAGNFNLGGVIIENPATETSFKRIKGDAPFLMKVVNDYHFSGNEALLATEAGVFHFPNVEELLTSENPEHYKYTVENGLSSNFTSEIIKTKENEYWISTGNGISKLNTSEKKATSYKKILNAKNFEFNHNAAQLTKDSIIYFGGTKGIVRFKPKEIYTNPFPPKVSFSDFRILNVPVPISDKKLETTSIPKDIPYVQKVTLKASDKIISFTINAVNFTLPEEMRYAHKMEGFDDAWIESENPVITRSNLDPGTYTLLAKAANNDGLWSETARLVLKMPSPWYLSWWAYLLYGFLAIGSVYLFLKFRLQQERQLELARTQERDIFRKRSSRDFHDEAGTQITRIALITELAKMNSEKNPEMLEYLNQIDTNLQELNSGMHDFIWALDPTKDNVFDTLNRFVEFAGKFCEYAKVQFKAEHISENLKKKVLNMSERRHLLLLLKEAINNSIKHANPSEISFKVNSKPGRLQLILKDNGKGFDNETTKRGNGLLNMKERAEALGGLLKIKSETNGGTKLTLLLETTRLGNG
ncbi:two-component regulator propeller domain-containing protein [Aequorivita todarodis]|uniref:sensor histidine kinase n=1 Tax=Aequorivita todarodis TaxID=2036821 RepID=UPI00235088C9|nr:sensor histidine kinase [Aequorivita todarodis]MDC8000495.1 two-component regulator propeller domain-containing protein [Aequorivita todarodis]